MIKLKEYKKELLAYLGYGKNQPTREEDQLIDLAIDKIQEAARPSYVYGIFDLIRSKQALEAGGLRLEGSSIAQHLKDADQVLILALSLGHQVDRLIRYQEKSHMALALILDFAGSVYVEAYADQVCQDLARTLGDSRKLTHRFSPGYGDFSLEIQGQLVKLVQAPNKLGLAASSHNILSPRKSITALMGLVDQNISLASSGCQACNKFTSCPYRKEDDKYEY